MVSLDKSLFALNMTGTATSWRRNVCAKITVVGRGHQCLDQREQRFTDGLN